MKKSRTIAILQYPDEHQWSRFSAPVEIVEAASADQVVPALRRTEDRVRNQGLIAVGFIAYEAASGFDDALTVLRPSVPLLRFGLYAGAEPIVLPVDDSPASATLEWMPTISREDYAVALRAIRSHIAAGRTYQVNFTYRLRAPFGGDPFPFFVRLARAQNAAYSAYLEFEDLVICSASPELFFLAEGDMLTARPMKGTAPRGLTLSEDQAEMDRLRKSEKELTENLMIVDMIRNDLGRIAEIGSVAVPRLFEVERYPTVLQMTSTVTARSRVPLTEVMRALFPCASVTGAPKASTMRIIAEMETTPRGVYTGCIGSIALRGGELRARFNVAIRTVTIRRDQAVAEYGVGGGITWDSSLDGEYEETRVKMKVLMSNPDEFKLFEAILWTPREGFFLVEQHISRLRDSAQYFAFQFDEAVLRGRLEGIASTLSAEPHKVRLTLAKDGACDATAESLADIPRNGLQRVAFAPAPVDIGDVHLFHKTSRRSVYETARAALPECDDVLLWNERGEITESCTANIVADVGGDLVTPPISCGLLPGTFRDALLREGVIVERIIRKEYLRAARRIYLVNSVRKWMDAELIDGARTGG